MKKTIFLAFAAAFIVLAGCAHYAENAAVQEFSKPSPTDLCRVDNIRAIRGEGIILSGFYTYRGDSLRHVTAWKDFGRGLERIDLTCPECEPDGPPMLIVHVKDYRIVKTEEPVYEITNPVKLAYIRKALQIEASRAKEYPEYREYSRHSTRER